MRKFTSISLVVEDVFVDGQSLVRIRIAPAILSDWCLCLQLVQDSLVEAFTFGRANTSKRVQIARGERSCFGSVGDTGILEIMLSASDLDFARHFFLRYYRDGAADVDHIDLETEDGSYIIFAVEQFLPPLSAEEAKRRLGV